MADKVLGLNVTSIMVSPLYGALASRVSSSESTPRTKTVNGSVKLFVEVKNLLSSFFISLEYSLIIVVFDRKSVNASSFPYITL